MQHFRELFSKNFYKYFPVFSTGYMQVFFISINTYFIAHSMYGGVLIAAFCISMIWSFNIKKVAFGSMTDRICYSLGATMGSMTGLFIANLF
jgi:hypothetical protein